MCFFHSPHSTVKVFSTYLRVGKRLKEQCFVPNPQRKQCLQLVLTDSIAKQQSGAVFLGCIVCVCVVVGGARAGVRSERVLRETLKTNHISGLISSK